MNDATNDTTRTDERERFDLIQPLTLDDVRRVVFCANRECDHDVVHPMPGIRTVLKTALVALEDLLRLAGPPCDYPPCEGKRAIEHTSEQFRNKRTQECNFHHEFKLPDPTDSYYRQDGSCCYTMINGMPCRRFDNEHLHEMPCSYPKPHPPSPAIEAWLRARSAK